MSALRDSQIRPKVTDGYRIRNSGRLLFSVGQFGPQAVHSVDTGPHSSLEEFGPILGDRRDLLEGGQFSFGSGESSFRFPDVPGSQGAFPTQLVEAFHDQFGDVGVEERGFNVGGLGTVPGRMFLSAPVVPSAVSAVTGGHSHGTSAAKQEATEQCVVGSTGRARLVCLGGFPGGTVHQGFVCRFVSVSAVAGHADICGVAENTSDGGTQEWPVEFGTNELGQLLVGVAGSTPGEHFPNYGSGLRIGFKATVGTFPVANGNDGGGVDTPADRVGFRSVETFRGCCPLIFGNRENEVTVELPGRSGGIKLLGCGPEMPADAFDPFEHVEGVMKGARKPVELPDCDPVCFAALDLFDGTQEDRAGVIAAGRIKFRGQHFYRMIFEVGPASDALLLELRGDQRFGSITHAGDAAVSKVMSHRCATVSNSSGTLIWAPHRNGPAVRETPRAMTAKGSSDAVKNTLHPESQDESQPNGVTMREREQQVTEKSNPKDDREGRRAAQRFAGWHLGDPGWANLIIDAYLNPKDTNAHLERAKGG